MDQEQELPVNCYYLQANNHFEKLRDEFTTYLENKIFTDVCISSRTSTVEAHKCILAANSDYFREQLKKNPNTQLIMIPVMTSEVLTLMLKYIYRGEIEIPLKQRAPLVAAAIFFNLTGLQKMHSDDQKEVTRTLYLLNTHPPDFLSESPKYFAGQGKRKKVAQQEQNEVEIICKELGIETKEEAAPTNLASTIVIQPSPGKIGGLFVTPDGSLYKVMKDSGLAEKVGLFRGPLHPMPLTVEALTSFGSSQRPPIPVSFTGQVIGFPFQTVPQLGVPRSRTRAKRTKKGSSSTLVPVSGQTIADYGKHQSVPTQYSSEPQPGVSGTQRISSENIGGLSIPPSAFSQFLVDYGKPQSFTFQQSTEPQPGVSVLPQTTAVYEKSQIISFPEDYFFAQPSTSKAEYISFGNTDDTGQSVLPQMTAAYEEPQLVSFPEDYFVTERSTSYAEYPITLGNTEDGGQSVLDTTAENEESQSIISLENFLSLTPNVPETVSPISLGSTGDTGQAVLDQIIAEFDKGQNPPSLDSSPKQSGGKAQSPISSEDAGGLNLPQTSAHSEKFLPQPAVSGSGAQNPPNIGFDMPSLEALEFESDPVLDIGAEPLPRDEAEGALTSEVVKGIHQQ